MLELGGGYTYEHETAKPFSGNRKEGVEASSKSEGDLDSWSYELRLDASIGSNTPVRLDVTPQGAGPDAGAHGSCWRDPGPRPSRGSRPPRTEHGPLG
ncbi:hypothetical protein KGD82_26350 [Nocardiopsis eucommiae]|uniref:Uncharacterized protein n=1 Tax=Nocardiopsis eucommiae TaxID=2831970 RepID=A0A975QKM8_9ACTN|nr:hypothetical protein KGD82_26350 [Nocardiopsis eucommiae]